MNTTTKDDDTIVDLGAASEQTLGIPKIPFEESTGQMDHRD